MTESTALRATELSDDGGHFYRADFHVHTPRDTQGDGARPQSEEERESGADSFVAAASTKELNAVAISDHHYFALSHTSNGPRNANSVNGDGRPERERLVLASFSAQRESELWRKSCGGAWGRLSGHAVASRAVQMAIIYPSKTTLTDST